MTDQTLRELWKIKDDIAKEHGYDLDSLVRYLRSKRTAGDARASRSDQRGGAGHVTQIQGDGVRS